MKDRTFEEWEAASEKIHYVSNDFLTISGLKNEFMYLGFLDTMINEMCEESSKATTNINIYPRITTLSRLWMMHAYEVIRSLDEFDGVYSPGGELVHGRSSKTGGGMANFATGRFKALKKELEKIRIPMVKQESPGGKSSAYFVIKNAGKKEISFVTGGEEISRKEMVQKVFEVVNNYERNQQIATS